eukprot:788562-Prorocentrum_minimum.AAC.1
MPQHQICLPRGACHTYVPPGRMTWRQRRNGAVNFTGRGGELTGRGGEFTGRGGKFTGRTGEFTGRG